MIALVSEQYPTQRYCTSLGHGKERTEMRYSSRELLLFALMWFVFGALACFLVLNFVFHFVH
jgi:hypothetical protein